MRRTKAFKRGRVISIVVAGFAGYLLGGWNGAGLLHSTALSAAQTVALRFPQDSDDAATGAMAPAAAATLGSAQVALLNPEPLVRAPIQQAATAASAQQGAAPAPSAQQVTVQMASAEDGAAATSQPAARPAAVKPAAATVRHVTERPGFILNDAQIASIKARLRLTADQEEMWPAVEAALRNLAYTRAREAHRHGTQANTQLASADSNGTDVQDLKSAAIPLIMSFNAEQKDEVRNIAHVMGLDQLANQF
jgi:hypothetical protein